MQQPLRESGLDALRVAGALLVMFAHGGYFLFAALPNFDAFALSGWFGTEVFFALTGFLVMREVLALAPRTLTPAARYAAWRVWRIVPLFWLALLVHLIVANFDGRGWPPDLWRYPLLVQNVTTAHPAFFGEAWNLPVIVLFSLIAPGLMIGAQSFAKPRTVLLVLLGVLIVAAIGMRAEWVAPQSTAWDEGVRKLVVTRIDACLYGALAACLMPRIAQFRIVAAVVVVAALTLAVWIFAALPRDANDAVKVFSFVASGVATAAACVALTGAWRGSRIVETAARCAYPLYLVNMPLLFVFAWLGFGQTPDAASGVLRFICWFAVSLLAAVMLHYTIERPLLAWGRRTIKPWVVAASNR
jgi:peptidoglycan/LPS O-acetylase OafA/YrhL